MMPFLLNLIKPEWLVILFQKAFSLFANILFTPTILEFKERIVPYTITHSVEIVRSHIIGFKAEINFRKFLTTKDQIEYDVYYFEDSSDTKRKKLKLVSEEITIYKTKGQIPKAIINFEIDKNDLINNKGASHIVFVARLKLKENKYYPIGIKGEERYIGATYTTFDSDHEFGSGFTKRTVKSSDWQGPTTVNTLEKLLSKKAWKSTSKIKVR